MSEALWRFNVVHRTGWRLFLLEYPPRVLATTSLPRLLLQSTFFVLLGGVIGGAAGERYALVGAAATTMTLFTAVSICDVPGVEVQSATFYRHRIGVVSPFAAYLCRSVPHLLGAIGTAALTVLVVAPLTGNTTLVAPLAALLPVYFLMAVTSAAAGLAVGILSTPSDNEILTSNVLAYAILIGSGAIIPVERLGVLAELGAILPMRHGLSAIRALLDGQPSLGSVLAELAVGAGWLVLAWAAVRLQVHRARARGAEDFA